MIFLLSFLPALVWVLMTPLSYRFTDFSVGMGSVGQVLGLIGAIMFAINMILSARLKIFERNFDGLNKMYGSHNFFGQLALILLILHPLFLLPKYAGNSYSAGITFLFGSSTAVFVGTMALLLTILLIVLSIYFRPKYNVWKITHKFFGVALFLAGLHIWLIPSDISSNVFLRLYMLFFYAVAIVAFLYRAVFGRFFVPSYKYIVKEVTQIAPGVTRVVMVPQYKKMDFFAGQYVFVRFLSKGFSSEVHPFSIASDPADNALTIIVKNLGDYTANVSQLSLDAVAIIEGPYGSFIYKNAPSKNQIWIAGGIGITPFLSMAKDLKSEDSYKIDFYYCVRDESELVEMETLKNSVAPLEDSFEIVPFCSAVSGRISAEVIAKTSNGLDDKDIFVCAPPMMIASLRTQFADLGVKKSSIHSEEFNF